MLHNTSGKKSKKQAILLFHMRDFRLKQAVPEIEKWGINLLTKYLERRKELKSLISETKEIASLCKT